MDNISIFLCGNCESYFGLFFKWDEVESEREPTCCCVCGSDDIDFIKDSDFNS